MLVVQLAGMPSQYRQKDNRTTNQKPPEKSEKIKKFQKF